MSKNETVLFAGAIFLLSTCATAQELVYQPVNPSFGGDSFNSAHLLSIAEIGRPDPPQADDPFDFPSFDDTQADAFTRQLESRILSQLSADITDAIFGDEAEPQGVFQFDQTTIAFETLLDGTVRLEITDLSSGGVTAIEIPSFLAGGG
ncbi:MAG: curli assembly protein CsgF [Pseudomonadota bacterium]